MKRCVSCQGGKSVSEFGRDRSRKDGLADVCKPCRAVARAKTYADPENRLRKRQADQRLRRTPEYRKKAAMRAQAARGKEWRKVSDIRNAIKQRQRFPERVAARAAVYSAIKSGSIVSPGHCESCATTGRRLNAHHDDYSKPLVVRWLCTGCHAAWHRRARGQP